MILHAIDKNGISLKKDKKYLVLVTYLLENFEIQQNTIIFVLQKECDNIQLIDNQWFTMTKDGKKLDFYTFYSSKYLIIKNLQLLHRKVTTQL